MSMSRSLSSDLTRKDKKLPLKTVKFKLERMKELPWLPANQGETFGQSRVDVVVGDGDIVTVPVYFLAVLSPFLYQLLEQNINCSCSLPTIFIPSTSKENMTFLQQLISDGETTGISDVTKVGDMLVEIQGILSLLGVPEVSKMRINLDLVDNGQRIYNDEHTEDTNNECASDGIFIKTECPPSSPLGCRFGEDAKQSQNVYSISNGSLSSRRSVRIKDLIKKKAFPTSNEGCFVEVEKLNWTEIVGKLHNHEKLISKRRGPCGQCNSCLDNIVDGPCGFCYHCCHKKSKQKCMLKKKCKAEYYPKCYSCRKLRSQNHNQTDIPTENSEMSGLLNDKEKTLSDVNDNMFLNGSEANIDQDKIPSKTQYEGILLRKFKNKSKCVNCEFCKAKLSSRKEFINHCQVVHGMRFRNKKTGEKIPYPV